MKQLNPDIWQRRPHLLINFACCDTFYLLYLTLSIYIEPNFTGELSNNSLYNCERVNEWTLLILVMLSYSLFIVILMNQLISLPSFRCLKDPTLSWIIPKSITFTANSLLIQSKGDVTGSIPNVCRWLKKKKKGYFNSNNSNFNLGTEFKGKHFEPWKDYPYTIKLLCRTWD